jgi:hypothetical protein
MFNITHKLSFASQVSVTEQQNKPDDITRHFAVLHHDTTQHKQTVHTTHSLILISDNTPTHSLTQFPVHSMCMKLLKWNYTTLPVAVPSQPQQPHSLYTDCEQ